MKNVLKKISLKHWLVITSTIMFVMNQFIDEYGFIKIFHGHYEHIIEEIVCVAIVMGAISFIYFMFRRLITRHEMYLINEGEEEMFSYSNSLYWVIGISIVILLGLMFLGFQSPYFEYMVFPVRVHTFLMIGGILPMTIDSFLHAETKSDRFCIYMNASILVLLVNFRQFHQLLYLCLFFGAGLYSIYKQKNVSYEKKKNLFIVFGIIGVAVLGIFICVNYYDILGRLYALPNKEYNSALYWMKDVLKHSTLFGTGFTYHEFMEDSLLILSMNDMVPGIVLMLSGWVGFAGYSVLLFIQCYVLVKVLQYCKKENYGILPKLILWGFLITNIVSYLGTFFIPFTSFTIILNSGVDLIFVFILYIYLDINDIKNEIEYE